MELQQYPILSVRFKMPEPRKNYIVRHQIFEKLNMMSDYKLTVIKAGAGSGKTTLLSSYVRYYNLSPFHWLSLDEHMNQPFIFWKYVVEEMSVYFEEEKHIFKNFFEGNVQKETIVQMVSILVNYLEREDEIILVFDDFHCIKDDFLIESINYFIKSIPSNVHLVLLTRDIPPIYLGELSMEDQLMLIEESIIRLSETESIDFLKNTLKLDMEEEKLYSMVTACEGWIGGLQLMAASLGKHDLVSKMSFANHLVEDYLSKEIFAYLSLPEQEFLMKTSIFSYFNQQIVAKLLPDVEFAPIMESILCKNLFVINIDNESRIYRYHAILKDYLNGLFERNVEDRADYMNQAAKVFIEQGDYEEGLNLLFSSGNYVKIMDLLLKMPQTALTFTYIMKVPLEAISQNPDFAYQYFFCHYATIDMEGCEKIYHYIVESLKYDKTFEAFQHANLFFDVNWNFKIVNVIPLKHINHMPLNPVTKAYLLIKEAYVLFASERCNEALEYLDSAKEVYLQTKNDYIGAYILSEKTQILEENGDFMEALAVYEELYEFIKRVPTLEPSYHIGIAGVYIRQLNLEKAREALDAAKSSINPKILNMYSAYMYTLAEYCYLIGDSKETERILEEFLRHGVFDNIVYSARLLRYPICRGEHKELAAQYVINYQQSEEKMRIMEADLLLANILYEMGNIEEALELSINLLKKAREQHRKLKIIEGDLLRIKILFEQKRNSREVVNMLVEAITYSVLDCVKLPFWYLKDTMKEVYQAYENEMKEKLSQKELQFFFEVIEIPIERISIRVKESENQFGLSDRETQVFKELEKGCSNKEIANSLCISLATVKSHIINIYGKLGVNNRVAALNKMSQQTGSLVEE